MEASDKSIRLLLDEGVADAFTVPKENVYMSDMHVESWHTTLQNGFNNGIATQFKASDGSVADLTLKLSKTEIFFEDLSTSATVVGGGGGTVYKAKMVCKLMYQAYLLSADGNVVAKDLRTVSFPLNRTNRTMLVDGAVRLMYETLASELLAKAL